MLKKWIYENLLDANERIHNSKVKKHINDEEMKQIMEYPGRTLSEKLYLIYHEMNSVPMCRLCGEKPCTFINFKVGHTSCCSQSCAQTQNIPKKPIVKKEKPKRTYEQCTIKRSKEEKHYSMFKLHLAQKHIQLLDSFEEFPKRNNHTFKCDLCGNEFSCSGEHPYQVTCSCTSHNNSKENEIKKWIISLGLDVEKLKDPVKLNIYLPEYKLGIELDDLYYNSELFKEKFYHYDKSMRCKENGIQLIHVFGNEWETKKEIVKSIILSKLGISQRKFYARQCEIKEIDSKTYRAFVEENHMQGYVAARVRVGLFYKDELVQICSFGMSRFKKGEIELIRSCSKLNTQVTGGFEKIIKYFVSTYNPENLISFVDVRYFDGHGYKNWELVEHTSPNYFYWNQHDMMLESRVKYQKHKLCNILEQFDPNYTEVENMYNNNYIRIWDCGNLKFKFKK